MCNSANYYLFWRKILLRRAKKGSDEEENHKHQWDQHGK